MIRKNIRFTLCAVVAICAVALSFPLNAAHADSFTPSRIIDDSVFDNVGAMAANQIDAFLNTFPNSCISPNSGFAAIDPTGYNPTSGFQYGGYVTAGRVIYDAAQAYTISPLVLLTTLQKEQSLVAGGTNFCENGDMNKYAAAVGYGCPDSGSVHSYTGLSLYRRNGAVVSSTGPTCVNSAVKAGFSQQVIRAAWLLKFGEQRSEGNIKWAVIKGNWDNSDDPQTCYGGPTVQGTLARCPSGGSTYYDGYTTIDATAVHMDNGASAALYWYTPHFSGNQHFYSIFTQWFGSTRAVPSACSSRVADVVCVWRLQDQTGSQFLTTSISERDTALKSNNWFYVGTDFYAFDKQVAGSIPVYRLLLSGGQHFYTTDTAERDALEQNTSNVLEGVVFYVYPSTTSANAAYPIYRANSDTLGHTYTLAPDTSSGFTNEGICFYTPSGAANAVMPSSGRDNVYRLVSANGQHFYTSSLPERDAAILASRYTYEGVAFDANAASSGTPVYRFYNESSGAHFYTISSTEKGSLDQNSSWKDEGAVFYVDNSTPQVYQLYDSSNGDHLYTTSVIEAASVSNTGSWKYEKVAFGGDPQNAIVPLYRMFSPRLGHFYSTNINEILGNVNVGGWAYEEVAFNVGTVATTKPVYRLYNASTGEHFYTINAQEKDSAITSGGFTYEGIAYYGSETVTGTPVYRLVSKFAPSRHFYTINAQEKDSAITSGAWTYEGVVWYD